ncbi:LptF/LptG family permease [Robiginitomaculum antarcticum]|uniref:LptF/LptG family permease n=1 Tax=Robiginitomaculum antarcticum TaxID=437507 RepID=UPI00035C290F|nr:LptF/LptG family permease [Robiginitomaculum antarcticum]
MKRIQSYFRYQTLVPFVLAISALSFLALLTQSLTTIDLIVENRQSALTFIYITMLILPQLLGIIMPIAVFIAALFSLNRMNIESEIVVAKGAGYSPWQIASPVIRVAIYAMIVHLFINLFLQPFSQREMREALLDVRTDLASQLVRPGEFNTPAPGLTVYTAGLNRTGEMRDVLIYDSRDADTPSTYTAKSAVIGRRGDEAVLVMREGDLQYADQQGVVQIVGFDDYQFDLSEVMTLDPVLRLKTSDQYLHELFLDDPYNYARRQFRESYLAEGHSRLATPFYNIALVMIALCFLVRGDYQRLGYGKRIAMAAGVGFIIRLAGFAIAAAAEDDSALNAYQYGIPVLTIITCGLYLFSKKRAADIIRWRKRETKYTVELVS